MNDRTEQPQVEAYAGDVPAVPRPIAWTLILGLGIAIWSWDGVFGRRPDEVPEWGWRLLSIFLPTILALMLRPMAGGAVVLLAVLATVLFGALRVPQALGGYIDSSVWLVLAAFMISRALIKTGLARRIALTFIRLMGHHTLGLSYAVMATDTLLAGMIPSNAARVGGVLLPITRNLAELYKSYPGRTAGLLGSFLMLTLYQGDVISCAMFLTGQASNPLAAAAAAKVTATKIDPPLDLTYAKWFLYASVPGLVSLLLIPWLIYKWTRPTITRTPEAAAMARDELARMGPPSRNEWIVIAVFLGVCGMWIHSGFFQALWKPLGTSGDQTAIIALAGVAVLLLTRVLTWEDVITEKGAWDVYIWYGGLVQLGKMLYDAKVTEVFAKWVAAGFPGWDPMPVFIIILLIYFYAHYCFASITTHILSMYQAFVGVLLALGAPPILTASCFAFFTNFAAGLTHYGTTPAPIVFGAGYVTHGEWWRIGLLMSLVNITIWLTVGLAWWWLLGLW